MGASVQMLDKFVHCGAICAQEGSFVEKLEAVLPKGCAVDAFLQFDEWLYLGSAASGARSRLSDYLRRQRQRSGKLKHAELRKCLEAGLVEFWVLPIEPRVRQIDGYPVDWLLGVEHGLIKTLHPRINARERVHD
ncbi:hypothetical protein [Mesorhizobium sp. CAU 1741]|uniref:hypothetical protein n=1 Tax=Mesorhizobium sp. CAU 1741 TaxID=3140366 RepID=UPI00325B6626